MKKFLALFIALLQIIPAHTTFAAVPDETVSVIVELAPADENACAYAEACARRADALISGLDFDYIYDTLICGFAAELPHSQLWALEALDFVENVYYCAEYEALSVSREDTYMRAAEMIGYNEVAHLSLTGDGVKVAVIDSGFDVTHPAFDAEVTDRLDLTPFGKEIGVSRLNALVLLTDASVLRVSSKIPFAYDYVGNDTDVSSSADHGTHVAGIIGAVPTEKSAMHGIAPGCQLLLMKVFDDEGKNASTKALLAALEDAVKLGADVINLSMGLYSGSADPSRILGLDSIIQKAEKAGCTVVCASGNYGITTESSKLFSERGLRYPPASYTDYGTVSSPAAVQYAIAAASADNSVYYIDHFRHTYNTALKIPFSDTNKSSGVLDCSFTEHFDGMTLEYAVIPGIGAKADYNGIDAAGKIALISRGTTTFVEKVGIAADHGAVAAIIYNNDPEIEINMELTDAKLPAIAISMADGLALIGEEQHSLTFSSDYISREQTDTAGQVSLFSSYGVTPSLTLKPDITAIGGSVYSTLIGGGYGGLAGTSMAAPQISGVCTLLREKAVSDGLSDPTAIGTYVKNTILNTAVPILQPNGAEYSPRAQGAGLIDLIGCVTSDIRISYSENGMPKAELYDKLKDTFSIKVTIENLSTQKQTLSLDAVLIHDSYKKLMFNGHYGFYNTLEASADPISRITADGRNINRSAADHTPLEITLDGGERKDVDITFTLDKDYHAKLAGVFTNGYFAEGFIYCRSESSSVSMPYMGYIGDWGAAPVTDSELYDDEPVIFEGSGFFVKTESGIVPAGADIFAKPTVYNRELIAFSPNSNGNADLLYFSTSLLRNIKSSTMTVTNSSGDTVYTAQTGYVSKIENTEKSTVTLFSWDGSDGVYKPYKFPDGKYTVVLEFMPDYEEADAQSVTYPVIIDTKSPTVSSAEFDGRRLTVSAEDETGIMSISVYEGSIPGEDTENSFFLLEHGTSHAGFDISGFDGDRLYCEVIDYAYNVHIEIIDIAALRAAA